MQSEASSGLAEWECPNASSVPRACPNACDDPNLVSLNAVAAWFAIVVVLMLITITVATCTLAPLAYTAARPQPMLQKVSAGTRSALVELAAARSNANASSRKKHKRQDVNSDSDGDGDDDNLGGRAVSLFHPQETRNSHAVQLVVP